MDFDFNFDMDFNFDLGGAKATTSYRSKSLSSGR